jgi:Icc-related predicted phosphoesterase
MFMGNVVAGGARFAAWEAACSKGLLPDYTLPAVQAQEHVDECLYARFLEILGALNLPCYIVPGHLDAPERIFLQASLNCGAMAPTVALVHRSFAQMGRTFLVAGLGGRLTPDRRETTWAIEYPFWEAALSLDFSHRLNQDHILLFHTPPTGTDLDLQGGKHVGAPVVNALIKAFHPKIVFCGHAQDGQGKTMIDGSLVVNPGPLAKGYYSILDTQEKKVYFDNVR